MKHLEFDFLPQLSAQVRRVLYRPLGVLGIAFFVAVLCGLALHPRVYALAAGLGLVMVLGTCWPWLSLRFTIARVAFGATRITEGETVEVTAQITNPLPWPILGMMLTDGSETVRLGRVGSRSKIACRWEMVPEVRGVYPRKNLRLTTGFPFGIWEPTCEIEVASKLIVWPKTLPVGPVPMDDSVEVVDGNVTRNKVGTLGDVLGVRPYRRGDSPRRIHWSQTARHDRLIVCELQANIRPLVVLVLDSDPRVHTSGPQGSQEWAIRVVASFAKGWLEAGAKVGLVVSGIALPPASGTKQLRLILDALAQIDEQAVPLNELLSSATMRSFPGIRVVVSTEQGIRRQVNHENQRWVVLETSGFPGNSSRESESVSTCDEATPRTPPRAWLNLKNHQDLPRTLRQGSSEARHGS
jgi:uncharacterized protein (DUF58 family)